MIRGNEKGLTLVEVLAVLVVGSIVMIFAFNLVASGMKSSNLIKERASVQNEANYMLVVFREFHERGNPYRYGWEDDTFFIEESTGNRRTEFTQYQYQVSMFESLDAIKNNEKVTNINPKTDDSHKSLYLYITITSKNITHPTETILQRL